MSGGAWDPSLYAGSAAHYVRGRLAYPARLVDAVVAAAGLDGSGRLLDLGCGPGSLTVPLARHVEQAVGVDPDAAMLAEAAHLAAAAGAGNVQWVRSRAEDLATSLGPFRLATLAQSFHWMDRAVVARMLHDLLGPGGAVVVVRATTHEGVRVDEPLPHPRPPRDEIDALVRRHLGERPRAGAGRRPAPMSEPETAALENGLFRAAGFGDAVRSDVPGELVVRSADDVVHSVFSLSSSTPHRFGDRVTAFEADLRTLLADVAPDGVFTERMRASALDVWRL